MGLDMYLSKKTYVQNWDHMKPKERHKITVKLNNKIRKDIKQERISHITEQVMYWRKANQIHKWFVENCQEGTDDCGDYRVTLDQLSELAQRCEDVVKFKTPDLLPTDSGFFFGSNHYDEYYYDECQRTADEIRELLSEDTAEGGYSGTFYYGSSW